MTTTPAPGTQATTSDKGQACPISGACPLMAATKARWNPYVVGALMGLLSWAVFGLLDKPLGISTSLSAASGACAMPFLGSEGVLSNAYWSQKSHVPAWNYGMLFLVGTFLGALISSLTSRSFKAEVVPTVWQERFGYSPVARLITAFVGGAVIMVGARMAGGCTSGHGISGSLQLALSSWVFFLTMFATGVLTALVMFGLGRRKAA